MPSLKLVSSKNPRQFAVQILQQRRVHGEFTENLLDRSLAGSSLSPVDRALCHEIVYGVVRRQGTLDWLIARKTDGREQKAALQNLLRTGLYQIFWLDRIPPHAAVHETVEIAKRLGFGPQAGFINAILRGYLREAEATKKLLEDLKTSDPATGYSHPDWLVKKWRKQFGDERARRLLEWNNLPPKNYARVNALAWERRLGGESSDDQNANLTAGRRRSQDDAAGDLIERWRAEGVEYDFVRRDWLGENLAFELKSHPPLASLGSFRDGWFYVQDPSTLLAPLELGVQPGETVLDLCAAPGGKTTFIAQLMGNQGKIIACDVSDDRLKWVRENCERLGVTCVETIVTSQPASDRLLPLRRGEGRDEGTLDHLARRSHADAARPSNFDRILVDAPCSNTGVMRRRVDLRWRITSGEIGRLQQAQLDLLKLAATKLKPGGTLVYSTCSVEPEENGEVTKEFLRSHPGFVLGSERSLFPPAEEVDGAYVARFKKA